MQESIKKDLSNIEAENAVLGCLVMEGSGHDDTTRLIDTFTADGMCAEWFVDPYNREIAGCILEMYHKGEKLDALTVRNRLTERYGQESEVARSLQPKIANIPTTAYAEHYFDILRDRAKRRELVEKSEVTIRDVCNLGAYPNVDILVQFAEKRFLSIDTHSLTVPVFSNDVKHIAKEYADNIKTGNIPSGLKTGYSRLDDIIGGLRPAEMIVLAARPSVGKTSLAMNICENVARQGHGVAVFSLEMTKRSLLERMLFAKVKLQRKKYYGNLFSRDERETFSEKFISAADELQKLPIFIDDTSGATIDRIRSVARRLVCPNGGKNDDADKPRKKVGLIVIDYLQLIAADRYAHYATVNDKLTEISAGVKAMAKELDVPVIALSQLNRDSTNKAFGSKGKGGGKDVTHDEDDGTYEEPMISHLRGSGSIEQDADAVIMLNHVKTKDLDAAEKEAIPTKQYDAIRVRVLKNRNGERGKTLLRFDRAKTLFEEVKVNQEVQGNKQREP